MLTQRADEIIREHIPFIDVTADFAYKTLLAFGLGLGLNIVLVIGVGHGILVAHDAGLSDRTDKHAVRAEIHILFHL